jgi:hypothetical protein
MIAVCEDEYGFLIFSVTFDLTPFLPSRGMLMEIVCCTGKENN